MFSYNFVSQVNSSCLKDVKIFLQKKKYLTDFNQISNHTFRCLYVFICCSDCKQQDGFNVSAACLCKVLSKHFLLHFLASSRVPPKSHFLSVSLSLFPGGCLRGIYHGCQAHAGPLMRDDWALIIARPCRTNGSRWASISCDLSLSTQMLFLCVCFCANDVVWCLKFTVLGSSLFM